MTAERPHGYARYKTDGCRCYTCCWATSEYSLNRERAMRAGTWAPFVDAEPVREHVRQLMASGLGRRRIATLCAITDSVVHALMRGKTGKRPPARIRPDLAAKLLALTPNAALRAGGTCVGATGAKRRIQALACLGWTLTAQAAHVGWTTKNYANLLNRSFVTKSTADKIGAMFDALSMTPAPRGYGATRIRNLAAARGWVPPLAWDEDGIDDPGAKPAGVAHKQLSGLGCAS